MTSNAYKSLTDDEVQEIAGKYFVTIAGITKPQDHPTITLIGAQPGAGKSATAGRVLASLDGQGGAVRIDADRMRELIPTGEAKPSSQETQADAQRLVATLRRLAIDGRRHLVEEGTFRDPDGFARFVDARKSEGYGVELVALAANREESLLGIYQRFEKQHHMGTENPRFVDPTYHDKALKGFDETVARHADRVDRTRIVDRSGAVLYDSASGKFRGTNAYQELATARELSDTRLRGLGDSWKLVTAAAAGRAAPQAHLEDVAAHGSRIEDLQKVRIHEHALRQVPQHAHALASDQRFDQHTRDDLAKAAYYRGFHEKSTEFKGMEPDFGRLDAAVASRASLRTFPGVDDLAGAAKRLPTRGREQDGHSL